MNPPPPVKSNPSEVDDELFNPYEDDDEAPFTIPEFTEPIDSNGKAIDAQPAYDVLINAELMLPQRDAYMPAKVVQRTVKDDGSTMGTYNANPLYNTVTYDVEFPDGEIKEYAANIIAENMLRQLDPDEKGTLQLHNITNHMKTESAVPKDKGYMKNWRGKKRKRKTTTGWKVLMK